MQLISFEKQNLPVKVEIKSPRSVQAASHQRNFQKPGSLFINSRSPLIESLSHKLIKRLCKTKMTLHGGWSVYSASRSALKFM